MEAFPSFARDSLIAPDTNVLRRKLSFSTVSADELPMSTLSAPEKLRVLVRARPLAAGEKASDMVLSNDTVAIRTTKPSAAGRDSVEESSFAFDNVLDGKATQQEVFDAAMRPQVRSLFAGHDTLTFAYGITNAGKTYTIQGRDSDEEMGVVPRALQLAFAALEAHRARNGDPAPAPTASGDGVASSSSSSSSSSCSSSSTSERLSAAIGELELDDACTYELRASFLEVYGSDAYDLLALPSDNAQAAINARLAPGAVPKRVPLKLKEDRDKGIFVEGLKEVELPDFEAANAAVQLGWAQRAQASNGVNDDSSRSHAVLVVKLLCQKRNADPAAPPTVTRLCVVDLAGAERQKKTNADGKRLDEARKINQDLMILGRCLSDLRHNQLQSQNAKKAHAAPKVPPYRESRITMLFRDYLTGSGQISVIAAVSPRLGDAVGTLDTLRFAAIANQVKVVQREAPVFRREPPLPSCAMPGQRAAVPPNNNSKLPFRAAPAAPPNHHQQQQQQQQQAAPAFACFAAEGSSCEPSGRSSIYSCADGMDGMSAALEAENTALREQVLALQKRILGVNAEKLAMERTIRDELATEMREHLKSSEEEMRARLEMERYNQEELYQQKLKLVRDATEKATVSATVSAHEKVAEFRKQEKKRDERERELQAEREKRELEAKAVLERVQSELGEAKETIASLEARLSGASEAGEVAQAAQEERAERWRLEDELAAEKTAREAAEAELAASEQARREAVAEAASCEKSRVDAVAALDFQLQAERDASASLQKENAELRGRLSNVVELSRQASSSRRKSNRGNKASAKGAGGGSSSQPPTVAEEGEPPSPTKRGLSSEAAADESEGARHSGAHELEWRDSPKRSRLSRLRNASSSILGGGENRSSQNLDAEASEGKASEGKASKQSKLMQMGGAAVKAMMGGGKKDRAAEDPSQVYLEVGGSTSFNAPEPTPIARRTRAGRAAAH